jgi:hypothetical protein
MLRVIEKRTQYSRTFYLTGRGRPEYNATVLRTVITIVYGIKPTEGREPQPTDREFLPCISASVEGSKKQTFGSLAAPVLYARKR